MTDATVTMELPDEPRWSDGPIRIALVIANPTSDVLEVSVGYPIPAGLSVTVLGGTGRARAIGAENVRFIPLRIAPHATATTIHELRRYVELDGPGVHHVRVAFAAHATRGGTGLELGASRELEITLAPPDATALTARIHALLAEVHTAAAPVRAAAIESLSWVRTPSVIPALTELAGITDAARPALVALAEIDTPDALRVLGDTLPAAEQPALLGALGALQRRGRALPPATVRALLGGSAPTQQAVLSYLAEARIAGFVADATSLAASTNPAVAAAAQHYLAAVP